MNTKLYAICGSLARPIDLFVTTGQVSDYIGARALLGRLPNVKWLLGDRGYDADWFREALPDKDTRLYPWTQATQDAGQIRQAPLQTQQKERDHVRQAQGLAARSD